MMMKIGIPRGLMFYRYFAFWKTFLEDLGNEAVISPPTSRRILEAGVDVCVDDICVAVKIFFGHMLALAGEVDCVMVPRMVSVERSRHDTFTCPKLIALPDMAQALPGMPEVLELLVDVQRKPMWATAGRFGLGLTRNPLRVLAAYRHACRVQARYERLQRLGWGPDEAFERLQGPTDEAVPDDPSLDLCIAILSHPYLIYDEFLNQDLQGLLRRMGARVLTPPMLEAGVIEEEAARFESLSWSYEKDLVGAGSHFLKSPEVDGIIFLVSFACGPDSLVAEIILREVRDRSDNPITMLVIDEHTGMAGVHTRVEAFVDMVRRRKSELVRT
ncbi:MAG: acyl-CoA dehydratase activase-related protein [Candidatus Geothermincolia bacterium]